MKWHLKRPRRRSVIKWLGTLLTVAILVARPTSGRWSAQLVLWHRHVVTVTAGKVWIWSGSEYPHDYVLGFYGPSVVHRPVEDSFWFASSRSTPTGRVHSHIEIPLWALALVPGLPALWLWTSDLYRGPYRTWRRSRRGLCRTCGYDLRGADHSVCPECGTSIAPDKTAVT